MDQIFEFLNAYRAIIGAAVMTVVLTVVIIRWWDQVKLFWKSFWYSLPVVGKATTLSKDTARDKSGWFRSEKILCDDFYSDIRKIAAEPEMYDRAKSYLGKCEELGRNELGIFMWVVVIGLVFVEALGFAYVLSGYTLPGASESMQVQGAFGIAFIISAVLVYLTHNSGAEIHKRSLIKKARTWWLHDTRDERPSLVGGNNQVSLDKDHIDDDDPNYMQLVNRLSTNANVTPGAPVWTIITVAAILFVAIGATVVRYETYKQERNAETSLGVTSAPGGGFSLDALSNGNLPDVLAKPQQDANQKAVDEQTSAKDTANLTTFAILAVLFILIQIMGVGIGAKTGFAGKEAKKARRIVGNFNSRSEYEAWFERKRDSIARIAQKHLTALQGKLTAFAMGSSIDKDDRQVLQSAADRTFMSHYETRSEQEEERRERDEARSQQAKTRRKQASAAEAESLSEPVSAIDVEVKPVADREAELRAKIQAEKEAEMRAKIQAEKEAEMRAKIEAELVEQAALVDAVETDEEMEARLRKEMGA